VKKKKASQEKAQDAKKVVNQYVHESAEVGFYIVDQVLKHVHDKKSPHHKTCRVLYETALKGRATRMWQDYCRKIVGGAGL
jgi:hypothetical protein